MQKTKKRHVRLSISTVPRVNIRLIFVEMNNANLLAYSYLVHLCFVYSSTYILLTVMHKKEEKMNEYT